jgi:hypothetical protein
MNENNQNIEKIKDAINKGMLTKDGDISAYDAFPPVNPTQPKIEKLDPQDISLNIAQAFQDFQQEKLSEIDVQLAEQLHFLNTHYCTDIEKEFTSHRFFVGRIIVFLKTALRPLIRMGFSDYLEQQKQFNAFLVRYCNTIQKKIDILTQTMRQSRDLWHSQDIADQTYSLKIEQHQKQIDNLRNLTRELNYRQQLLDEKLSISQ